MLSKSQIQKISSQFRLYEHEWRYLQCYVGEPFEYKGYLIFDDGRVLNICAFSLLEDKTLSRDLLHEILGLYFRKPSHKAIHLWGNFELVERLTFPDSPAVELINRDSCREVYEGEYTINLEEHSLNDLKAARKAINNVRNKGLFCSVRQIDILLARHRELIEIWRSSRPISVSGAISAHSVSSFLLFKENIFVVEVAFENLIYGFSVFSFVGDNDCVNLMSFSEKSVGMKIEDALLYKTICYAQEKNKTTLHLGYAGNSGLVSFKEKWGAQKTGPDYRQVLYVIDPEWCSRVKDFDFFWISRLISPI